MNKKGSLGCPASSMSRATYFFPEETGSPGQVLQRGIKTQLGFKFTSSMLDFMQKNSQSQTIPNVESQTIPNVHKHGVLLVYVLGSKWPNLIMACKYEAIMCDDWDNVPRNRKIYCWLPFLCRWYLAGFCTHEWQKISFSGSQ